MFALSTAALAGWITANTKTAVKIAACELRDALILLLDSRTWRRKRIVVQRVAMWNADVGNGLGSGTNSGGGCFGLGGGSVPLPTILPFEQSTRHAQDDD